MTFTNPAGITPAMKKAAELLTALDEITAQRRRDQQRLYQLLWNSPPPPDDVIAAMGADALTFLRVAQESVRHLGELGTIRANDATAFFPPGCVEPRRQFSVDPNTGAVTLEPPADGFDAWGLPVAPDPEP